MLIALIGLAAGGVIFFRHHEKELVRRVRSLELELEAERQRHAALAYDKQALLARFLRTEADNALLRAEQIQPGR